MAQPIPLDLPPRDPRAELQARLENAPLDHAEALLGLYEVAQGLHDSGALEALRGALASSDKIVTGLTNSAKTPESIRAIRNLLILSKTLAAIDPEVLKLVVEAIPAGLSEAASQSEKPPGLWALLRKFRQEDTRRGLAASASILGSLGKNLAKPERH
jgi:uncharacterized protein YjgD (DUF1641 family)